MLASLFHIWASANLPEDSERFLQQAASLLAPLPLGGKVAKIALRELDAPRAASTAGFSPPC